MKQLLIGAMLMLTATFSFAGIPNLDGPGALPTDPEPGQCFLHKFYPAEYAKGIETVMIKEGYKYYTRTLPVIGTDTIFHVFNTPDIHVIKDPVFGSDTIKIQIKPDDPVWKVKCCPKKHKHHHKCKPNCTDEHHTKACEQACYKPVRPIYKVIEIQTTEEDGSFETIVGTEEIFEFEVPIVLEEGFVTEHTVDPEYMDVTVYSLIHPGYMQWEEGTCKKYTCRPVELQEALKVKGYYHGALDGKVGPQTIDAMNQFRADNGLGIHDEIDAETAKALGIAK